MQPRRLGLEQEFFLVDADGQSSDRADDLIARCRDLATSQDLFPECFTTEWVQNILEINVPVSASPEELAARYIVIVRTALDAARSLGIRLYPLAVYPLHLIPKIRDAANYHVQVRTVGLERFLIAGKCTGTHLHLEVAPGTIDNEVAVRYDTTAEARKELLDIYNFATALDPAIIALSRACPFYEGESTGLAHRTTHYRGSRYFGWEGVYSRIPEVGTLRPYANSIEHLVALQFERHYAWLEAMDHAGVDRSLFLSEGGGVLRSSWNPIRLNPHGTVELRNLDSNLPRVVLGLMLLAYGGYERLRADDLTVMPTPGAQTLVVEGNQLLVPDFEYLEHHLLFSAVARGLDDPSVTAFTESVLEFASPIGRHADWLAALVPRPGDFETTEARLLKAYYPEGERLTRDAGLALVRDVCTELETQIADLESVCRASRLDVTDG